ncbi:MAG: hypothetical protein RLZ98_2482 [Pseudomonadota bacterium]|jgi:hypothetical protein
MVSNSSFMWSGLLGVTGAMYLWALAMAPNAAAEDCSGGAACSGAAQPLAATSGEGATLMHMSVSQWRAHQARLAAEKMARAKAAVGQKDAKKPSPVRRKPLVDVWTTTKVEGGDAYADTRARHSKVGVGVDVGKGLKVGTVAEFDSREQQLDAGGATTATGRTYMVGPFATAKITERLTLDARAAWGESEDAVAGAGSIAADRSQADVRLKGNWQAGKWRFTPHAAWSRATEDDGALPVTRETVTVTPEFRRELNLEGGAKLEPFVHYKSTLDLGYAKGLDALEHNGVKSAIGGGFKFSEKDKYRLEATTEVEGLGGQDDSNLKSRLQITVPLK